MFASHALSKSHLLRVRNAYRLPDNRLGGPTPRFSVGASLLPFPPTLSTTIARARGQISRFSTAHAVPPSRRRVRGIALICAALATGLISGALSACGLKTWWYTKAGHSLAEHGGSLHPHVKNNTLDTSSIVRSLREQGWTEVERPPNVDPDQSTDIKKRGRHLVHDVLADEKGLLYVRGFRHPEDSISVLVFLADDGLEGWPSVVHGGLTSALVHEALEVHMGNFPGYKATPQKELKLNYLQPVMTNKVYAITISTAEIQVPYLEKKEHTFAAVAIQIAITPSSHLPQNAHHPAERANGSSGSRSGNMYLDARANVFLISQGNYEMIEHDPHGLGAAVQADFDHWIERFEMQRKQ